MLAARSLLLFLRTIYTRAGSGEAGGCLAAGPTQAMVPVPDYWRPLPTRPLHQPPSVPPQRQPLRGGGKRRGITAAASQSLAQSQGPRGRAVGRRGRDKLFLPRASAGAEIQPLGQSCLGTTFSGDLYGHGGAGQPSQPAKRLKGGGV